MRGVVVAALLGLCVGVAPGVASAQTSESSARAAARKLGYDGVELYQAGKYQAASEKLEKAFAVLQAPSLGLWSARALAKLGKLVEATDRYLEVTRLPLVGGDLEVQKKALAEAQSELDVTQRLIPSVTITVEGASSNVELRIDGSSVAKQLMGEATPLNPGQHRIEASAGEQHVVSDVTLAEGEQKQVKLQLSGPASPAASPGVVTGPEAPMPSNPPAPSSRRTVGWVALGGGALGIAVGGIAGALAVSQRSKLDQNPLCADDHSCPPDMQSDVNALNTWRTVSTVGFIAGGVLAATGVALILTAPKAQSPAMALWLSPAGVRLSGGF